MSCRYYGTLLQNACQIFDKTKNKGMEKVCIEPVDESIKSKVDALNILNEYKRLGFGRSGFVGVVQQNIDSYKDYKKVKKLLAFWDGRSNDESLNNELENLLEKLKDE